MKSLGVALLLVISAVAQSDYKLYHRINSGGPSAFTLRATISLSPTGGATYQPANTNDYGSLSAGAKDGALYQIALERPTDRSEDEWDLSSAKACHVLSGTSDIISLVVDPRGSPFGVDYHVLGVPRDGSCPNTALTSSTPSITNTTVLLKRPHPVPSPILRVAPPLSPEGRPIVPPPEKSLIQKYWYYGIPIVIILLMTPPEEEVAAAAAKP